LIPGGSRKNLDYVADISDFDDAVTAEMRLVLADAQTSGGLLLAVPRENESALLAELEARGTPTHAVIGEIVSGEAGRLRIGR
jgi:selenide,water dikinase